MSNTIRFTSREAFVQALEDRRPFWRDYDAKQERQHKADEKAWLNETRAKLREVLKLDYDALKIKLRGYYGELPLGKAPECPVPQEPRIDKVLRSLALTQSKSFTVDSRGTWDDAHWLLTHDPDERKSVC